MAVAAYSVGLTWIWQRAAWEAWHAGFEVIGRTHLTIALAKGCDRSAEDDLGLPASDVGAFLQEMADLRRVWQSVGVDPVRLRRSLRRRLGRNQQRPKEPLHRDSSAREAFARAEETAVRSGAPEVSCRHLLSELCAQPSRAMRDALAAQGATAERLRSAAQSADASPRTDGASTSVLGRYGRDLTELARRDALDPAVGRDEELREIGRVLLQRTRGNVLLTGAPGVGKTRLVEALAQRMCQSAEFAGTRIVELRLADLVAGTTYRGEFEERMQCLLGELESDQGAILFLDEIHTLIGAGAARGTMDAANLLKPALSEGAIRCIGATTTQEYHRHLESDQALMRRFHIIEVHEPPVDTAIEMVRAQQQRLEAHHRVRLNEDVARAAVLLTARYLPDRRLPDKAVELVDEACAHARFASFRAQRAQHPQVSADDLATLLEQRLGLPPGALCLEDKQAESSGLRTRLSARIKGQPEAIDTVVEAVELAAAGLVHPGRPRSVMLFVGPTGTGKTELAKVLAEALFHTDRAMVRIDMSEYSERYSVSRLVGSPPGYVGHEEGGQLTTAIRERPHSVVLLDEFEKAHPAVHRILLQVLDEGRLTDGHGRLTSFRDAYIVLTSNLSTEPVGPRAPIGLVSPPIQDPPSDASDTAHRVLLAALPPEFVNRIDRVARFRPLDEGALFEIVDALAQDLDTMLAERGVTVCLSTAAKQAVVRAGWSPTFGARGLRRAFERLVSVPVARRVTEGAAGSICVTVRGGELIVEPGRKDPTC